MYSSSESGVVKRSDADDWLLFVFHITFKKLSKENQTAICLKIG